ncbi:MAG: SLC13 family permease [Micrococcales bacterium]|nr:SLC13 family permease [Micrococcales bacterium]
MEPTLVGVVAILTALSLFVTGVLTADEALAGFGDRVVIFVAALFVVSEGLDATGVTTWAGQAITDRTGTGRTVLLVSFMVFAGVLSAVVSPNGAVAALLPMVVVVAVRQGHAPSQLLIPLAFAAHGGSLLALSGSPVNVIVSNALADAGGQPFKFFDFTIVGLPLLIVTVLLAVFAGPKLLPNRAPTSILSDLGRHAATLSGHYALQDGFYRLRVTEGSCLTGATLQDLTKATPTLSVLGLQIPSGEAAAANHLIGAGDAVSLSGSAQEVICFAQSNGLNVGMSPVTAETLMTRQMGVVDVVVPPRSPLVGERFFPGMVRQGTIVVLAIGHLGLEAGRRWSSCG